MDSWEKSQETGGGEDRVKQPSSPLLNFETLLGQQPSTFCGISYKENKASYTEDVDEPSLSSRRIDFKWRFRVYGEKSPLELAPRWSMVFGFKNLRVYQFSQYIKAIIYYGKNELIFWDSLVREAVNLFSQA